MRAAIYARVSQDSRGGRSVAEQEQECRAWVQREGWTLSGVWTDNSIGASKYAKKARPEWQALVAELDAGRVDVLVVWEPSRATRDRRVWAALAATCEEHGVRLGCNGRLYDLEDADDAFQLDLFFALATRESGATRKRVLRSVRANAESGRPHGRLLYGYQRTYAQSTSGPRLVSQEEHPEQSAVVREVARRVHAGEAMYAVAADLNGRSVPAPSGGTWAPTQVKRLCVNPSYIAKRVHKGKVIGDATWPAILDEETHRGCVLRLTDPSRRTNVGRGARHLLSGLARCGICDGPMTIQKNRGFLAYLCREGFHVSRKREWLDDFVTAVTVKRLGRPDLLDLLYGDNNDDLAAVARVEALEKRSRLNDFYDLAAAGDLSPVALVRIESRLLPEIEKAERRGHSTRAPQALLDIAGPDAESGWHLLSLEQQREVINVLLTVRVLKTKQGARDFDPLSVEISWKTA